MGMRIRRPMAFQGMTRKEAKVHGVIKGDFVMKVESLEEQWKHWNESSESYLDKVENKPSQDYGGRGTDISFVKKTISAPQDNSEGIAITTDTRQQQLKLNRMKKHSVLANKGTGHIREACALQAKIGTCGIEAIRAQENIVEHMRKEIKLERTKEMESLG
eukprot:12925004-Heterocapsa_arctica.AAC.1